MMCPKRRLADHGTTMAVQIHHPREHEARLLTASSGSLLDELRTFLGGFDRPTIIFWSTQILCWLLVVGVAMLWGIGGL